MIARRNSAQLVLLASLATLNTALSVLGLLAYATAAPFEAAVGTVFVGLLWLLWLSSFGGWLQGPQAAADSPTATAPKPSLRATASRSS